MKKWNSIILICGNHEDDFSHVMEIKQGPTSLFYSCPLYIPESGEKSCRNRITLADYEKILEHIEDVLGDVPLATNIVGHRWTMRGIKLHIISCENDVYKIVMLNKKALND